MARHISEQYDSELDTLRSRFMTMGGMVERQLQSAIKAYTNKNSALAMEVRSNESQINEAAVTLSDEITAIIARRQPAASDLRLLVSVMKNTNDLERVGDEAKRIAKLALLNQPHDLPANMLGAIVRMNSQVSSMLSTSLDSFVRLDLERARETVAEDKQVDSQYHNLFIGCSDALSKVPSNVDLFLSLIWVARSLERIGDHTKNIAESIVYLVEGHHYRIHESSV